MKYRDAFFPWASVYSTLPASMRLGCPERRARAASAKRFGVPIVLRKSAPVPCGKKPSSTSAPERKIPLATSLMVPSPPNVISSRRPARDCSSAMRVASPSPSVKAHSKGPKWDRTVAAALAQERPAAPPPAAGLMMMRGRPSFISSSLNRRILACGQTARCTARRRWLGSGWCDSVIHFLPLAS